MKFLIANEQATLTSLGAANETKMVPVDSILCIQTYNDTYGSVIVQGFLDVDDEANLHYEHEDASVDATHKAFRTSVDGAVSLINGDYKSGVGVLYDALNNVYFDGMKYNGAVNVADS